MRIVVVGLRGFPHVQGGVETHCEQLYTRLAALGHEVTVLGRRPYMDLSLKEYKRVKLVPVSCPRRKSLEAILHTLLAVFKARTLAPDILHVHAIGPSLWIPLARVLGMKVVSTNHGPDYARAKWGALARVALRMGESLGCRFSNSVIAISEPIAAALRNGYRCKPFVVPNGVVPRTPSRGSEALKKYELERGRYLLAVGRLVPEKGFHDLIAAFGKAQLHGWKLVIAGRADHEDAYSIALKELSETTPGVVMTGFVTGEPLVQLYSHAGLFVLPSYHEGLPIVLLEAMSYGLPVVASDIPANRQAALPDECFFAPGDIAAAAAKIGHHASRGLTPDEKLRQIAFITRTFDWGTIADKTLEVYAGVV